MRVINFKIAVKNIVPSSLSNKKMLAWIDCFLSELRNIYNDFVEFREKTLYKINFTGQKCYLEKLLNETFDCEGIYLEDVNIYPEVYLSNKFNNDLPVYFGSKWQSSKNYKINDVVVYKNYWYRFLKNSTGVPPQTDNAVCLGAYQIFLGNIENQTAPIYDFIVYIPYNKYITLSDTDFSKIKSIVNYYKLIEKNFIIKHY